MAHMLYLGRGGKQSDKMRTTEDLQEFDSIGGGEGVGQLKLVTLLSWPHITCVDTCRVFLCSRRYVPTHLFIYSFIRSGFAPPLTRVLFLRHPYCLYGATPPAAKGFAVGAVLGSECYVAAADASALLPSVHAKRRWRRHL